MRTKKIKDLFSSVKRGQVRQNLQQSANKNELFLPQRLGNKQSSTCLPTRCSNSRILRRHDPFTPRTLSVKVPRWLLLDCMRISTETAVNTGGTIRRQPATFGPLSPDRGRSEILKTTLCHTLLLASARKFEMSSLPSSSSDCKGRRKSSASRCFPSIRMSRRSSKLDEI